MVATFSTEQGDHRHGGVSDAVETFACKNLISAAILDGWDDRFGKTAQIAWSEGRSSASNSTSVPSRRWSCT